MAAPHALRIVASRPDPAIVTLPWHLPLDEWTSMFGSERLGALLDRLTPHFHILEMNGESYRLKTSRRRQGKPEAATGTD